MSVGERIDSAPIVTASRIMTKGHSIHENRETRPADAFRMNIGEQQELRARNAHNVRRFSECAIPRQVWGILEEPALPAQVCIHAIAPNARHRDGSCSGSLNS